MATVIMRWLETKPSDYDRGIELLTLGRLQPLKERIANDYIWSQGRDEVRVLEIGCGTGSLAALMALKGASVVAIDSSEVMLQEARFGATRLAIEDRVSFYHMDGTELADRFEPGSFDVIVSTLVFSEFQPEIQQFVLREASQLLNENGQLLIVDEMVPSGLFNRMLFWTIRLPLVIITWLLTRTTTSPLRNFNHLLKQAGFHSSLLESHLGGSLKLVGARVLPATETTVIAVQREYPRLRHQVTFKTFLLDLLSLVYRIFPPYPKRATGLYRIGEPDEDSPVLVTGNYDLTVRKLVNILDGSVDCWLLIADSQGINVWCAAGGGHFTADDIIAAINSSGVSSVVKHRALILPQLGANGIDGWRIRESTKWGVHWGPVRASDIPAYLFSRRKKSEDMRQVKFPLRDRLEMTTVMLALYALLLLIPFIIFWRSNVLLLLGITVALSYFYGAFLPWIPGKDGLEKGIALSVLAMIGLWTWSMGWGDLSLASLFGWSLGLAFLAFFVGAEFQGMSPKMRGEQANWLIEGVVGLGTLSLYALGTLAIGAIS